MYSTPMGAAGLPSSSSPVSSEVSFPRAPPRFPGTLFNPIAKMRKLLCFPLSWHLPYSRRVVCGKRKHLFAI